MLTGIIIFWQVRDNKKKMHMLEVKNRDSGQKIAILWITQKIKYIN